MNNSHESVNKEDIITFEFKNNYKILFICSIIYAALIPVFAVLGLIINLSLLALSGISAIMLVYSIYKYFSFKKQHLIISDDKMDAYVLLFKRAQFPCKIKCPLSNIKSAYTQGEALVLLNIKDKEIKIFNLVDPEKAAEVINNIINSK